MALFFKIFIVKKKITSFLKENDIYYAIMNLEVLLMPFLDDGGIKYEIIQRLIIRDTVGYIWL